MSRQSTTGKLADVAIRQAKPKDKPYKLSDGGGMYMLVNPNGSRYWRMKYRFGGKEKVLALGVYPNVTISKVREKVMEAKTLLDEGKDPTIHKRQSQSENGKNTFKPIVLEWYTKESGRWSKDHAERVWQSIKADALPYLGDIPITDIRTRDVLHVVRQIEDRGALDVAGRVKQRISSVFRYAIQTGYAEFNPVDALKDVIRTRKVQHRNH